MKVMVYIVMLSTMLTFIYVCLGAFETPTTSVIHVKGHECIEARTDLSLSISCDWAKR